MQDLFGGSRNVTIVTPRLGQQMPEENEIGIGQNSKIEFFSDRVCAAVSRGAIFAVSGLEMARVIEMQPTPNPNATKFVLDRPISDVSTSFLSGDQAQDHPIARRLFAIPGVSSLLLLGDFVTVNKDASASWASIKREVRQVLADA